MSSQALSFFWILKSIQSTVLIWSLISNLICKCWYRWYLMELLLCLVWSKPLGSVNMLALQMSHIMELNTLHTVNVQFFALKQMSCFLGKVSISTLACVLENPQKWEAAGIKDDTHTRAELSSGLSMSPRKVLF